MFPPIVSSIVEPLSVIAGTVIGEGDGEKDGNGIGLGVGIAV
jgi:hypothetical protein